MILPTVTSIMYRPTPTLRERWIKKYGKDRFTFDEAREAQSFPFDWFFPKNNSLRWKWLAEAFPPRVAMYLFNTYLSEEKNYILLDLFGGIGGWSLGAIWTRKFSKIIIVEIDNHKCFYLKRNFQKYGNVEVEVICDDVRKINYNKLGNIDVVTSSPPCEDLSILKYFDYHPTSKGTIPLTLFTIQLVNKLNPKLALYENVWRKPLVHLFEKYRWKAVRFDMSKMIPQKRIRLIAVRNRIKKLMED